MTDEPIFHAVRMAFHEERESPGLVELPDRLKEQVSEELNRLKRDYTSLPEDNGIREAILADIDALLAASEDLWALRLNKILKRAEYSARAGNIELDSLTKDEMRVYGTVVDLSMDYLKVQP